MENKLPSHSNVTVAAIACLAFITACVAHEAVGHGGVCLARGYHIRLLTSVYFRCSQGSPATDAAGSLMNLTAGAIFFALFHIPARISPAWRLFLALAMAYNLFWGAGYFAFSAVTNGGDWAYVLGDLAVEPRWLWRCGMGLLGALLYYGSMRLVSVRLPVRAPLLLAYLSAGVLSCVAVLFFNGPVLPALRDAVQESFGVGVGLLMLRRSRYAMADAGRAADSIGYSNGWLLAALFVIVAFVATLGRGLVSTNAY